MNQRRHSVCNDSIPTIIYREKNASGTHDSIATEPPDHRNDFVMIPSMKIIANSSAKVNSFFTKIVHFAFSLWRKTDRRKRPVFGRWKKLHYFTVPARGPSLPKIAPAAIRTSAGVRTDQMAGAAEFFSAAA